MKSIISKITYLVSFSGVNALCYVAALIASVGILQLTTTKATASEAALSPAMQTVVEIAQDEFRGFMPGNIELLSKIRAANKFASADEVETILAGKKPGWIAVDVRNPKMAAGGYIKVDGNRMLRVGRQQPTSIMEANIMKIKDKKEVVEAAPENIVILCRGGKRSAFDYASYAAAGFNDVKLSTIMEWVKSCKPLNTDTTIEDAGLKKKGYNMIQRKDGQYYWDQCK
jgi:rhodanese-related sulfurtransferase